MRLGQKKSNPDYVLIDVISLLRIENGDNGHYIYIKQLERLFHTYACSATVGKKICPLCEKKIDEKEYKPTWRNARNMVKKAP